MTYAAALIILQARMGSRRLPGKVLAPLGSRPVVEHCIRRLQACGGGPVVLATTAQPEDAPLIACGRSLGVETFAGPVDDVLARFAAVVRTRPEARYIIRATADNPFVDMEAPARVLKTLAAGADYAVEEALPLGAAVEGVGRDVLLRAQQEAVTAYDREHVTPWVTQAEGMVCRRPLAPEDLRAPDVRLTVDTPADLASAQRLVAALTARGVDPVLAPLRDVIAVARHLPAAEGA